MLVDADSVDYMDVSPKTDIHCDGDIIPFLENDDVNFNYLNGCEHATSQAVPLFKHRAGLVLVWNIKQLVTLVLWVLAKRAGRC